MPHRSKTGQGVSRRQLLGATGTLLGSLVIGRTAAERTVIDDPTYRHVTVTAGDGDGPAAGESYCSLGAEVARELPVIEGMQLRLRIEDPASGVDFPEQLCTVAEILADGGRTVRVDRDVLDAIGAEDRSSGAVSATAPHPRYRTRSRADENDEFVERVENVGDGGGSDVVVLAPHGGYVEKNTGRQALVAASEYGVPAWTCFGFNSGGGAYDRWHVTSTEIHPYSFPALRTVARGDYGAALAFHGHDEETVRVGGGGAELRAAVGARLADAYDRMGVDVPVEVVDGGEHAGVDPANVVNWVTADGSSGVQIEQSFSVRDDHFELTAVEAIRAIVDSRRW